MIKKLQYLFLKYVLGVLADIKVDNNPWKFLFFSWRPKEHLFKDSSATFHEYTDFVKMVTEGKILPGDIFFSSHNGYMSSFTIPGDFSHAGMYVGKTENGDYQVVHAMAGGVIEQSIFQATRTDMFIMIRPKNLSLQQIQEAVKRAKSFIGRPYDYIFEFKSDLSGNKNMCCTETVYKAYEPFAKSFNLNLKERFILNHFKKVPTIVCDDFFDADISIVFKNQYADKTKVIKNFLAKGK